MLNQNILDHLNKQIALEADSSQIYLAMASWCEQEGLKGSASFFYEQSEEERMHMLKIIRYVNEMNGNATIPAVSLPANSYSSIQEIFNTVAEQERTVTRSIHHLLSLSQENQDHATTLFLQWYVAEQREEEAQVQDILDKINLIGNGPMSLYYIDKEIDKINKERVQAEAEESLA